MMLWLVFALMTAAAVLAVLWPLARRTSSVRSGSDVAVYRDQLDELDRDQASGLVDKAGAEAARIEISRRLLRAADTAEAARGGEDASSARWRRRAVAVAALILLPFGSATIYLSLGSPGVRSAPLAAQEASPASSPSLEATIAQVEVYLARNPQDGRGWEVIAPVYMRLGRFDDAVKARRNALDILGPDAARLGDLGEALVFANNGIVSAEAQRLFERAAAADRDDVMASYYLGVAAKQDGRRDDAEKIWRGLVARAPQGAPWLPLVQNALARIDEKDVPGKDAESAEHGGSSVRAMVERLAERLKKDGSDLDGWVQLVRSYKVLGDTAKATAAIADAEAALASDPDKLRRLAEAIKSLEAGQPAIAGAPAETRPTRTMPGPSAEDMAAAAKMAPDQQSEMIGGMVARLAARLKQDGSDPDGWLRLVRAYTVLGDRTKARAAAADARRALANDAEKLRRFDAGVRELGVEG